jgi:hypothetical protein
MDKSNIISKFLTADEKLVWSGSPKPGYVFRGFDLFLVIWSLGFSVIGIFMFTSGMYNIFSKGDEIGGNLLLCLFSLPFIFMGLYAGFGRIIANRIVREGTIYGLTNERLLIYSGLFSKNLRSIAGDNLKDLTLTEKEDGSGTISWRNYESMQMKYDPFQTKNFSASESLERISNVRSVYELIRRLK